MRLPPALLTLTAATIPLAGLDAQCTSSLISINRFAPNAGGAAATPFPGGIAYDPITDILYVVDQSNDLISSYDRTGAFIQSWPAPTPLTIPVTNPQPVGAAVDAQTGNLWICDEAEVVYEFDPSTGTDTGVAWSTLPAIGDASALAFDQRSRTVFISDDSSDQVQEYDLSGVPIGAGFNAALAGSDDGDGATYDPTTDTIWIGNDTGDQLLEVDRTGALVNGPITMVDNIFDVFAAPLDPCETISPEALAIDTRTGSMFISGGLAPRELFEVVGLLAPLNPPSVYGAGCPDSSGSAPSIRLSDPLVVGRSSVLALQTPSGGLAGGSPVTFLIGFGPTNPVSFDLSIVGFPGCTLLVDPAVVAGGATNGNGRSGITLALGNDAALVGIEIFAQGIYLDGATLSFSDGVRGAVQ